MDLLAGGELVLDEGNHGHDDEEHHGLGLAHALEAGASVERAVDVQSQELGAIRRGAIGQGEVLVEHLEAVGHRQECAHCD